MYEYTNTLKKPEWTSKELVLSEHCVFKAEYMGESHGNHPIILKISTNKVGTKLGKI